MGPDESTVRSLVSDLFVDRYLTVDQCWRRYGISHRQLVILRRAGRIRLHSVRIRPAYRSTKFERVGIVSLPQNRAHIMSVPGLSHVLGLAEMRWVLRHRIQFWRPTVGGIIRDHIIDIVAFDEHGELLVEYDTGLYRTERILKKAEYADLLGKRQIWGTPTMARAITIARLVPGAEVWLIRWIDGYAERVF